MFKTTSGQLVLAYLYYLVIIKVCKYQLSTCSLIHSYMILQYDSNKLELGAGGSPNTKYIPPSLRDDRTAWQSESMNQSERGS